jgi:hypothetical protein
MADTDPQLVAHGLYAYQCESSQELAYFHPSSVFHRQQPECAAVPRMRAT